MKPRQGDVVRRGDTGTLAVVVSNAMLHDAAPWLILCSINKTAAHDHPAVVVIGTDTDDDTVLRAVPTKIFTVPASAVVEIVNRIHPHHMQEITRIMHAATSA